MGSKYSVVKLIRSYGKHDIWEGRYNILYLGRYGTVLRYVSGDENYQSVPLEEKTKEKDTAETWSSR